MRQIVLDTETTGLGAETGHRIIEIGCLELVDRELTGAHFHHYLNPERSVDEGAFRIHGLSNEFLKNKQVFADIAHDLLDFIEGAELIIHNAPFDLGFLNMELKRIKWEKTIHQHCTIFDTLVFARAKHPGQRNNLDALCKRYDVDNTNRKYHGALLDAEILATVYLAMTGGQGSLFAEDQGKHEAKAGASVFKKSPTLTANTPVIQATPEELKCHEAFTQDLIKKSGVDRWSLIEEKD